MICAFPARVEHMWRGVWQVYSRYIESGVHSACVFRVSVAKLVIKIRVRSDTDKGGAGMCLDVPECASEADHQARFFHLLAKSDVGFCAFGLTVPKGDAQVTETRSHRDAKRLQRECPKFFLKRNQKKKQKIK